MYDSFKTKKTLKIGKKTYTYFSFKAAEKNGLKNISSLPFSIKVLLENLIRNEDGTTVSVDDIKDFDNWKTNKKINREINFRPARVLMQDFTGVPAVVDLASMRSAIMSEKGDPKKVNPLSPVDLVIDHSVMVDKYGSATSYKANVDLEYKRNIERYEFLRWGQKSFNNFRVVPPGTGICHQVNLEYLAKTVWSEKKKIKNRNFNLAYPDTVVGTDSHTTMINGLSVLGWGVGGIEAEAAMLGQPISMVVPEVIGFEIKGKIKAGITATDLVLTITEQLRQKGVVGKFVEFYGAGLKELSVPDRATFSIDIRTVESNYLYLKEIKKILKSKNVKLKEIVNLDMVYNEKWKNQQNLNLLKHICKLNKKSFTPKFANYFTDISPFQKYCDNPFNIIVGPGITQQAHQTNEYVKKDEIIKSRKIYEYLINEIC